MKTHSEDTPHKCQTCGKVFKLKVYLKRHFIIHTSQRPYKSSVSPKAFSQSSHLSTHTKTHKVQDMAESYTNDAACSLEISSKHGSDLPTAGNYKGEDSCLPPSASANLPFLHSSDTPYIMNVKTEDDM